MTGRTITFPPVESFGRLTADKWLALKTLEEAAETVEAVKAYLQDDSLDHRYAMTGEIADVIQTIANLCAAFGITDAELREALEECRERNRRKGRMQ